MSAKKDLIVREIHEVGQGRMEYPTTSKMIADGANCSKTYAMSLLNHYCETGWIARIRVAYKNTVKDYFCSNESVENSMEWLEKFMGCTVLEVQVNGEWVQCLTVE